MKLLAVALLPLLVSGPALAGVAQPVSEVVPDRQVIAETPGAPTDDGDAWQERSIGHSPTRMAYREMAYDEADGVMVMFGGFSDRRGVSGRTYTWDGSRWQQLHLETHPSGRLLHSIAYDPVHGEVVLFGGYTYHTRECGPTQGSCLLGDTWAFKDGEWYQLAPPASPPPRYGQMMAFDPVLQQVILFGGSTSQIGTYSDETWAWDGSTWTKLDPSDSPSARETGGLAYDPSRGRLVLFGGYDGGTYDDTWSWDGTTWVQETMRKSPPARFRLGMSTLGGHVAAFGGGTIDGLLGDTWILKSNGWQELHATDHPVARFAPAMGWDPERRRAVLFGGDTDGDPLDDTWTLRP